MTAKDAIKRAFDTNYWVLNQYLSDLSDADLLVRPVPGANHIAWQLGHLIVSEVRLMNEVPGPKPELPAGFEAQHSKETAGAEPAKGFKTKAEYLALLGKVRESTLARLAALPDADLDRPSNGPVAQFAPTLGAVFMLTANHQLMHAGQFTVVRRKLGKPVVF
ncbi:MAG TPA: DinB family protein [Gemmataceae bacterium]|nr:DinB family protein [Gemmataceae bacterium]